MLEIGAWNTLKVIRSKEHGIYLGEEDCKTAETVLLPRKQVPPGVKAGDVMRVFLYRDSEDRMIATTTKPYITMGEIKKLKVRHVTAIGAFMDWGLEKDLFLPYKQQTVKVKEGDKVLCALYIDKSNRLAATMKVYDY